jgi:deoxyribonucleoside regulator
VATDEQLERVARRYYGDGVTMEALAAEEKVSRSTVSRMLDAARTLGIVSITVTPVNGRAPALAAAIGQRHGVAARVVAVPDDAVELARLEAVGRATGELLDEVMGSGMTLGVAWGTTTSTIGRHLQAKPLTGAHVVQLNGAANTHSSGVGYGSDMLGRFGAAWDATVHHFPVPAFFDHVETRRAMWRERSVRRVLALQQHADVALFGIGAVAGGVPSRVWAEGYLTAADRADLAEHHVVGDVCTVFLRADGSWEGVPLNARSSGTPPPVLRHINRRICAVSGDNKVVALASALAAGLVTDLVIDEPTARLLLARRH